MRGVKNNKKCTFYKDVETGWYYLQSRYYNPELGRFINADGLVGPQGVILGHNMYAYTQNNPVMMVDPDGNWPKLSSVLKIVAVAAVITVAVALTVSTGGVASVGATIAISYAINTVSKAAIVGRAQYNKSKKDGDDGTEIFDDVVNAIGDTIVGIAGMSSIPKAGGIVLAAEKVHNPLLKTLSTDILLNSSSKTLTTGAKFFYTSSSTVGGLIKSRAGIGGMALSYGFSAINTGKAVYSYFDDDYAYDQATKMGWKPQ